MLEAWDRPANAGSPHSAGEWAAQALEAGKASIAELIGAAPSELVFTSGATEANNLALLGTAAGERARGSARRRIVVSAIEHKAVLEPARELARHGFEVVLAPVDAHGRVDLDALSDLVNDATLLVSVMAVNNETGVVQPVSEAAATAHEAGALFHCDAAQAAGKIRIDVGVLDVDYLSLSGHKCYGPMGIGALYIAAGAPRPAPLQFGGGQQAGVRPGTEPVPLIAGFGAAARAAAARLAEDGAHAARLADRLHAGLAMRQVRFQKITGDHAIVPGSLVIAIEGADADTLCAMLARTVQISTGSACTSGQIRISHVFESMGLSEEKARSVLRIFCSRYNDDAEIDAAATAIADAAARSRLATGEVLQ